MAQPTIRKVYRTMEEMHELMYFLEQVKDMITREEEPYVPSYMVLAIKLPTGAIELQVNTANIPEKIDYILENYSPTTAALNSNEEIVIVQLMVV